MPCLFDLLLVEEECDNHYQHQHNDDDDGDDEPSSETSRAEWKSWGEEEMVYNKLVLCK